MNLDSSTKFIYKQKKKLSEMGNGIGLKSFFFSKYLVFSLPTKNILDPVGKIHSKHHAAYDLVAARTTATI